ncbi:MAG: zinc dependent phospholipase C family protein [Clostridia bacterium]|nr:zinc dependent phospholipase C family protein [Clostridia bacterium]
MPSCITHQLISEESKKNLPEQAKLSAELYPDYYFLGTQGPDVFFFYKPFSKKEFNLGRFLHRSRVYDVFSFFAREVSAAAGEEHGRIAAYVAGYVCHYCTDTVFHPFVYRYLEEHGASKTEHQLIESDWDVYFAGQRGREAAGWKFPFSAKSINEEGTLYALYARLANELGRKSVPERTFRRGVSRFARYLKFFHGKSRAGFFRKTEKLFRLQPVCSSLYPRKEIDPDYLYGEEFERLSGAKSADELFSEAAARTADLCKLLFRAAMHGEPLPREEFNRSFLTAHQTD